MVRDDPNLRVEEEVPFISLSQEANSSIEEK
jgi:hypothetical protein